MSGRTSRVLRRLAPAVVVILIACSSSESERATTADDPTPPAAGASAGCADPDPEFAAVGENGTITVDGEERVFSLVVPQSTDGEPVPLVVDMHGALGNRMVQEGSSGFGALGREEGFAVLTPQARGVRPVWSLNPSGPDVAYLDALIDEVAAHVCIDTNRVYLTGFSMGGMMSMVLACREPDRFAAVAPVGGAIEVSPCDRDDGVPLLAFHGTADNAVRFDGSFDPDVGLLVGRREGPSRTEIVEAWSRANDCDTDAETSQIGDDVEHLTFTCPTGEEVEMYVIEEGGHTWPGGEQSPMAEAMAGRTTQTIDATRLIWDFFRAHSLDR